MEKKIEFSERTAYSTPPTIRILATKGLGHLNLKEIWEYRDLRWFNILRDIKGKYRQMAIGPLWIILQPMLPPR